MNFNEINPYIRYVRFLEITTERYWQKAIPCDCRLFFTDKGTGKVEIDNKILIMEKGDILLIKNGIPYHLLPSDVVYLGINFDYTSLHNDIKIPIPPVFISGKEKYTPVENVKFKDTTELNGYIYLKNMFHLKNTLNNIYSEYTKKLPFSETKESSLFITVLTDILRASYNLSEKENTLEKIITYLHQHYNEDITNYDLSEIFHFHPNYINEIFKKNLGISVHQYLLRIRISNAISMLESGEMSINEIANNTGFYDSSYFSRYFKKVTGISPKKYR